MINSDEIKQIQLLTSKQADDEATSGIWKSERRLYITSSNVKIIAQRRPTTPSAPTMNQLLYSSFTGNAATRYGLRQEESSCFKYMKCLELEKGSTGVKVNTKCELVVSQTHPWLAATPDGWVDDPQASPRMGLVEFKNPYSSRNLLLRDAVGCKKCTCLLSNKGIYH